MANGSITLAATASAAGKQQSAPATITVIKDTAAPTLTISANPTRLTVTATALLTFTPSEANTSFARASITLLGGGSLSPLTPAGAAFTATYTAPATATATTVTIAVAAGSFTDPAGNPNPVRVTQALVVSPEPSLRPRLTAPPYANATTHSALLISGTAGAEAVITIVASDTTATGSDGAANGSGRGIGSGGTVGENDRGSDGAANENGTDSGSAANKNGAGSSRTVAENGRGTGSGECCE